MGHPALATRHMTFLLQTMWPHLTRQEHRELAIQLQVYIVVKEILLIFYSLFCTILEKRFLRAVYVPFL